MEFESVQQCAQRLKVNVRTVQKWAKEGKLPGAKKIGRDWQIPVNEITAIKIENDKVSSYNGPTSLMNCTYPLGKMKESIMAIDDVDVRNLQLAEYYFYSGKSDIALAMAEPYLHHETLGYRYLAAMVCFFSSIHMGHFNLAHYSVALADNGMNSASFDSLDIKNKTITVFTYNCMYIIMRKMMKGKGMLSEYIQHLPDGMKLFSSYLLAHKAYTRGEYEYSYGIADNSLSMFGDKYTIPTIYLHIIAAASLVNLMEVEKAEKHVMAAHALAENDNLIAIFGESYSMLHGLAERCFKVQQPEFYKTIINLSHEFGGNFIKMYNKHSSSNVTLLLTSLEFTIAMLYDRGWRAKEIAYHLNIPERSVKKHLSVIYEKLDITNKKELNEFLLQ